MAKRSKAAGATARRRSAPPEGRRRKGRPDPAELAPPWSVIGGYRRAFGFLVLFAGSIAAYFVLSTTIHFRAPEGAGQRPVVARVLEAGGFVQREVVFPYQELLAGCSTRALHLLGFDVVGSGRDLRSPEGDFAVTVTNGCDAIEITLLLCLAIVFFPAAPGRKLAGAALGAVAIAAVNLLRIVSLWIIGRHWSEAFEFAHFIAWPFVLVCSAIGVFSLWLRGARPPPDGSGQTMAAAPPAA